MVKDYSDFFSNVFDIVRNIPAGRVTSYGAIGRYLGLHRSARMVGWAMNQAHGLKDVPAHRVVNKDGLLTGKSHFPEGQTMQDLLEAEGVRIKNDQVEDFQKLFWDPSIELGFD